MKILLIDLDTIIFRGALRDTSEEACRYCGKHIQTILEDTEADAYLGFITVGKESFRYKIFPDYKAHRLIKERPKWIKECRDFCQIAFNVNYNINYEADDLITFHSTELSKDPNNEVYIVGIDSDYESIECKIYNPDKKEFKVISREEAIYTTFINILAGKAKDNIPSICKRFGKGLAKTYLDSSLSEMEQYNKVKEAYTVGIPKMPRFKGYIPFDDSESIFFMSNIAMFQRNCLLNKMIYLNSQIDVLNSLNLELPYITILQPRIIKEIKQEQNFDF